MHDHDRERLGLSITLALLLHVLVAGLFWVAGWARFEPYPEYTPPLYVDLESSFVPEEQPEPEAEPLEEPEPEAELLQEEPGQTTEQPARPEEEPEVEPAAEQPKPPPELPSQQSEPPPAEPAPEPASQPAERSPEAPTQSEPPPATAAPQNPTPREPAAEAPQQTFDFEGDLSTIYGREEPEDRVEQTERPKDNGLFDFRQDEAVDEPAPLPDWVNEVMSDTGISTEEMETEEITQLARKIERDPELEALMRRANEAIERGLVPARDSRSSETPTIENSSAEPSTERLSDNAAIQWSSESGGRGTGGDLPVITPSDFAGPIPPKITFVVVFGVDSRGLVVPGSVVFQRKSGSTQVDRKVRSAVLGWKFLPKPGAGTETGVFTLVVERHDIR